VLLRLTIDPPTREDITALVLDADDAGCADYVLLCTKPSRDEGVRRSEHYLGPSDFVELCKRSHAFGWNGGRPVARDDAYLWVRRRSVDLVQLDNLGLSWLRALSRNRLPWSLRESMIPANEWFEIAMFRLATSVFRVNGMRLGAASRAKRVGDALLWWRGHLVLLDCKAAQDGYKLDVDDERRLVEYAKQRHEGYPASSQVECVVLVSSSFPTFDADRRRFLQRRRRFIDAGSNLACIRADDLVDAAIAALRYGDDTRQIDDVPWHRILAQGVITRDRLLRYWPATPDLP
jgi:hypothetical protein